MPVLEQKSNAESKGFVLDVGCGLEVIVCIYKTNVN
jgi:hypothetical protein